VQDYDGVIEIGNFRDIMDKNKGWILEFPKLDRNPNNKQLLASSSLFSLIEDTVAFVTVTGSYDKGKTFILNMLCNKRYPAGKKIETKGISFENTKISGVDMTIIDSAGSHSPIKLNEKIEDKKETEKRLRDIIFLLSDFFILVVNDYTTLDQEILEKLEKQLQGNKNKYNKEIIVIHNIKDTYDEDGQKYMWKKQIENLYDLKKIAKTHTDISDGIEISYLKTQLSRHVMLINDLSDYGKIYNQKVIAMISIWMKTFGTSHTTKNFYEEFFKILSKNLNTTDNTSNSTPEPEGCSFLYKQNGLYVVGNNENSKLKIICDDSKLNTILVEPNNFIPFIDIVMKPDEYLIVADIPGNVDVDDEMDANILKLTLIRTCDINGEFRSRERAFGRFFKEFKIPPKYEYEQKKTINNGVLRLSYEARNKAVKNQISK
jgi:HSP20 family molecular chaperone IbpA